MFISEEEARARLKSTDNLLNRLGISSNDKKSANDDDSPSQDKSSKVKSKYAVEIDKLDQVDEALEQAKNNPTFSSEDDAVRLAVLAGRRHLKTTDQRGGIYPQQGNVPPIFRSLIAGAARLGTNKGAAKAFGVSLNSVNCYRHGKTHQDGEIHPELLTKIERDTLEIRNQVLGVLAFTVAGITPESIENKDPKELSIIARNLSSIMSSTKPMEVEDKSTNAQVIVFSPEQGAETDYDRVEIG